MGQKMALQARRIRKKLNKESFSRETTITSPAKTQNTTTSSISDNMSSYLNPFNGANLKGSLLKTKTDNGNEFFVYLPPGYETKLSAEEQSSQKKFPILYHLHGAGSLPFITKKDIGWTAKQNELYDDKMPMIIVAPSDPSLFSMWADGHKSNTATNVLSDVIPFVESKYAVDCQKRYLQGFSMGGFGAATWAFKYQEKFQKVIILDGALHDWLTLTKNRASIAETQFDNNKDLFQSWSPWEATSKASQNNSTIQNTPILMYSGSMNATRTLGDRFAAHLKELGADYKYTQTDFSHCTKPFLEKYGQEIFAFLENE